MLSRRCAGTIVVSLLIGTNTFAAEQNACGENGKQCGSTAECDEGYVCISDTCRPSCDDGADRSDPKQCTFGETCVPASTPSGSAFVCKSTGFRVDLNLLDMCVSHFLEGIDPDLTTGNVCSLEKNLSLMLDQDGDGDFNIFDVDQCALSYLEDAPCDVESRSCSDVGDTYCEADADCGEGLYCSDVYHRCERECGYVANRDNTTNVEVPVLERECSGSLKACNYARGRCESVSVAGLTCQIDDDCPSGAYCFLGECTRRCYRSIDCPGSDWYCTENNICQPQPNATAQGGGDSGPYDPTDYAARFARKNLTISPIEDEVEVPVLIMSYATRTQVFDDPRVVFGFRLEASYGTKRDAKCQRSPEKWSEQEREDCLISADEEFLTLDNPFGTVYADGSSAIALRLSSTAAEALTPGTYPVAIRAIFSNGSRDTLFVTFKKEGLSGGYNGRLSVYLDHHENHLGNVTLDLDLDVDTKASQISWAALLEAENLSGEQDLIDITQGYPVVGTLKANGAMPFALSTATSKNDNIIAVKGIYAAHLGRMRLIAVLKLPADFCISDGDGGTCEGAEGELQVTNPFGRRIRRQIELIGPFDAKLRRFSGIYRETLSGLIPGSDATLEGGFVLNQLIAEDLNVSVTEPLLSAAAPARVEFPSASVLTAAAQGVVDVACEGSSDAAHFASREAFLDYLQAGSRIFTNSTQLEQRLQSAIESTSWQTDDDAMLSIMDFLRQGQGIRSCEPDEASADTTCVDTDMLRCGLALHQKALLAGDDVADATGTLVRQGWVDLETLGAGPNGSGSGGHLLFCTSTTSSGLAGCQTSSSLQPTLFVLQEHNRFHQELSRTLRYEAGGELTDAFFAAYKAAGGAVERSEAFSYKEAKLRSAWQRYHDLQQQFLSPVASAVLFSWPMASFAGKGSAWLEEMHGVQTDRLDALEELIDIKRRIFVTADEQDYLFVQQMMQVEYLSQVYLALLERTWHGQGFAYSGEGPEAMTRGESLLSRVNETRNPLGIYPGQVFFENSDLTAVNWKNYKNEVTDMVGDVQRDITAALADLRSSLSSEDSFMTELRRVQDQYEQTVDSLCGSAEETEALTCSLLPNDAQEEQSTCSGQNCTYQYKCEDEDCDGVAQLFEASSLDAIEDAACRVETANYKVQIGASERPCVRGQMGALLQEKAQVDLQRKQVFRKANTLSERIARQTTYLAEIENDNTAYVDFLKDYQDDMELMDIGLMAADQALEIAKIAAVGFDCWIIAGLAAGTNCPQKVAYATALGSAQAVKNTAERGIRIAQMRASNRKELRQVELSNNAAVRREQLLLNNLSLEYDNLISEYELLTQQLFNLELRVRDTYFQAQQHASRYADTIENLLDHLVGRETGNALLRAQTIRDASRSFQALLVFTYKMAMAFNHSYNRTAEGNAIVNKVFRLMTPEDVQDLVDDLEDEERDYCGSMPGLDCDYGNNVSYLRYSIRENLFPHLRDIVDADSGRVLTAGEQFHNQITAAPYLRQRIRAGTSEPVTQIEIPFAIPLREEDVEESAPELAILGPTFCNHIIVAATRGTMAVNIHSARLTSLKYEISRGETDYMRSCTPEQVTPPGGGVPVTEWPISVFTVGHAPHSALALQDSPPAYKTTSQPFTACINQSETDGANPLDNEDCYGFFARDRTLAAPDWRFVIRYDLNSELAESALLPEDERPIIEDIVLYIRYRVQSAVDG